MPRWERAPGVGAGPSFSVRLRGWLGHVELRVAWLELYRFDAEEGPIERDRRVESGRVESDVDLQVRGHGDLLFSTVDGREGRRSHGPTPGAALGVKEIDERAQAVGLRSVALELARAELLDEFGLAKNVEKNVEMVG